ncbi:chemotaxis protein CheB [Chloroflexia bacterium SDU3-3]|nr:chemotaxis protein CheB [Chloroflexia bacterium SDU3-3]
MTSRPHTSHHDIIVIGASAGGVEALTTIVQGLPADLAASLFVVLHIPPDAPSLLPAILSRAGPLPCLHATNNEEIRQGVIYIAPPDHHMLLEHGRIHVVRGPRENRSRPAIDPLFRSVAQTYGPRVIGVILTGNLDDGTAGLFAVKRAGGIAVVHDPADALYPSMPTSALEYVQADHCVPVGDIAALLTQLVAAPAPSKRALATGDPSQQEIQSVAMDTADALNPDRPGTPSVFSCPECGGVLFELQDGALTRYRCRVGHAFSPESMLAEQDHALETALWVALKTLEERAALATTLAARASERGSVQSQRRFEEMLKETQAQVLSIRRVLLDSHGIMGHEGQEPPL